MSQAELARRMGRPYQIVNDIVNGRRPITASTALQLEHVLGLPARFWMIREADYRLKLAREDAA
jgi:HTH-type transcriptional regulator/antitoxin HigA